MRGSSGVNSKMWRGDDVGYSSLHFWVRKHKERSNRCEMCNEVKNTLDLANISGKYVRDINDWEWLCRRCHMTKDGRLGNLKQNNPPVVIERACMVCGYNFKSVSDVFCSEKCCLEYYSKGKKYPISLTIKGIKKTVLQWSIEKNISYPTIRRRMMMGMMGVKLIERTDNKYSYHKKKTDDISDWRGQN